MPDFAVRDSDGTQTVILENIIRPFGTFFLSFLGCYTVLKDCCGRFFLKCLWGIENVGLIAGVWKPGNPPVLDGWVVCAMWNTHNMCRWAYMPLYTIFTNGIRIIRKGCRQTLNFRCIFLTSLFDKRFEYIITSSFAPIYNGLKLIHMQVKKKIC